MSGIGLTRRQSRLLAYIKANQDAGNAAPTFDDMKDAMGLRSKSGIHRMICGLEERGYIRRMHYRTKAIEVLESPEVPNAHPRSTIRPFKARLLASLDPYDASHTFTIAAIRDWIRDAA